MQPCKTMTQCCPATFYEGPDVLVGAGIQKGEDTRFLTICVQDRLTGCSHVCLGLSFAGVLIELVTRLVFLSST